MSDTKGKEKTAKRGAGEKRLNRWERLMVDPKSGLKAPVTVLLQFNERGDLRAVTLDQAEQEAKQLRAMGDEAIHQAWKEGKTAYRKNPQLRSKRAQEALSWLFVWAVTTGQYRYGDWLAPDLQRDLLDDFYEDAYEGIKRAKFQKCRYDTIDRAYLWIESKMIRFRKKHGIPNNESLSEKLSKEFYAPIRQLKRWRKYVEQHDNNEKALQRGILRRWHERYGRVASKKKLGALRAHSNAP